MVCNYTPYMGRRSLAEQIWEHYSEEETGNETWLVIYDFKNTKPPTKLYDNLHRIKAFAEDGDLIQFSVFMTNDQRAAKAVRDLIRHYDGQVTVFRGELTEL
jgi:hypothetical protein